MAEGLPMSSRAGVIWCSDPLIASVISEHVIRNDLVSIPQPLPTRSYVGLARG